MAKEEGWMIRRRGRKFEVWVYYPAVGRKVYVGIFATRGTSTEPNTARYEEIEAEKRFHPQGHVYSGTVAGWAKRWLEDHPRPEATTTRHNASNLELFLTEFGDRRLDKSRGEARR